MSRTILICGDYTDKYIHSEIQSIINRHFDVDVHYPKCTNESNFILLKPIDDKIDVESVLKYRDFFTLTSTEFNYRVGVIYDFNIISKLNQNKLLKTIEDNNDDCLQILVAENTSNILPTILSRVVILELNKLVTTRLNNGNIYTDIVKTNREKLFLTDNKEIEMALIKIYEHCLVLDFKRAYILFTSGKFKAINSLTASLVFRIIVTSLLFNKKYDQALEVVKLENRIYANINVNLQIESLFVMISEV